MTTEAAPVAAPTEAQAKVLADLHDAWVFLTEHPELVPEYGYYLAGVASDADQFVSAATALDRPMEEVGKFTRVARKFGSVEVSAQINTTALYPPCDVCGRVS